MGNKSKIEWTDATWNPVTGCTKVSAGCKNCYAERDFHRPYPGRDFSDVRCHDDRLDWPFRWRGSKQAKAEGRESRIFVNSMSDLFHDSVPFAFIRHVFRIIWRSPQHTFQILTKRPERMLWFCQHTAMDWANRFIYHSPVEAFTSSIVLPNVWLGVSVENQLTADERIPLLLQTPAAVRWVSAEPLLGPVDFFRWLENRANPLPHIDWVVAGGESGPHARASHPDWFRRARDDCQAASVPFFFKQWGEWTEIPAAGSTGKLLPTGSHFWMNGDGTEMNSKNYEKSSARMGRIGKKRVGRELDGREWNEFPEG
jgi:protein gp37